MDTVIEDGDFFKTDKKYVFPAFCKDSIVTLSHLAPSGASLWRPLAGAAATTSLGGVGWGGDPGRQSASQRI